MLVHCFELHVVLFSARDCFLSLCFEALFLKLCFTMYPIVITTGVLVCGTVVKGCIVCVFTPGAFGCKFVDCAIVCLVLSACSVVCLLIISAAVLTPYSVM
jgi:hypothetical protein